MHRRQLLTGGLAATAGGLLGSRLGGSGPVADAASPAAPVRDTGFWGRVGNRLVNGAGVPQRFTAANLYWLGLDDNLGPSPQYPSKQAIRQGLSAAAAIGCNVVRSHTLGISVGNPLSLEPECGEFNDDAFRTIDYAVATAHEMRLRLIVPLVDEWRYYHGGKWVFVQWAYERGVPGVAEPAPDLGITCGNDSDERWIESAFYTNQTIFGYFQAYISRLLTHRNPLTGRALGDDPTILAWETGNELWDATPTWTAAVAAHLKQLAPRTLVADGSAATGLAVADAPGLDVADVDIVGSHYYPPDPSQLAADARAAAAASKVMVVGEWPSVTGDVPAETWTATMEGEEAISGDAVWSVLPWRPDGHAEPHPDGYTLHVPGSTPEEVEMVEVLFNHSAAMRSVDTGV